MAAAIANSDPWKTGIQGFKLALAAYIIPFFFIYNQSLLGQGSIWRILLALISGLVGTFALLQVRDGLEHELIILNV